MNLSEKILKNVHLIFIILLGMDLMEIYEDTQAELNNKRERVDNLVKQKAKMIDRLKKAKEFEKNLAKSQKRVKRVLNQIESVQKQLPNTIVDTEILDLFSIEANKINIKDIFLTPLKEEKKGFYVSKKYRFSGVGTFLQFLIFFEKIGNKDRLFNVRSLLIKRADVKQKGRYQVLQLDAEMEAFRYNAAQEG